MIFDVVSLAKSGDVHQKKVIFSLRNQDLSCSEISGKDLKAKFHPSRFGLSISWHPSLTKFT